MITQIPTRKFNLNILKYPAFSKIKESTLKLKGNEKGTNANSSRNIVKPK